MTKKYSRKDRIFHGTWEHVIKDTKTGETFLGLGESKIEAKRDAQEKLSRKIKK